MLFGCAEAAFSETSSPRRRGRPQRHEKTKHERTTHTEKRPPHGLSSGIDDRHHALLRRCLPARRLVAGRRFARRYPPHRKKHEQLYVRRCPRPAPRRLGVRRERPQNRRPLRPRPVCRRRRRPHPFAHHRPAHRPAAGAGVRRRHGGGDGRRGGARPLRRPRSRADVRPHRHRDDGCAAARPHARLGLAEHRRLAADFRLPHRLRRRRFPARRPFPAQIKRAKRPHRPRLFRRHAAPLPASAAQQSRAGLSLFPGVQLRLDVCLPHRVALCLYETLRPLAARLRLDFRLQHHHHGHV